MSKYILNKVNWSWCVCW